MVKKDNLQREQRTEKYLYGRPFLVIEMIEKFVTYCWLGDNAASSGQVGNRRRCRRRVCSSSGFIWWQTQQSMGKWRSHATTRVRMTTSVSCLWVWNQWPLPLPVCAAGISDHFRFLSVRLESVTTSAFCLCGWNQWPLPLPVCVSGISDHFRFLSLCPWSEEQKEQHVGKSKNKLNGISVQIAASPYRPHHYGDTNLLTWSLHAILKIWVANACQWIKLYYYYYFIIL